jgi:hypothetical protein
MRDLRVYFLTVTIEDVSTAREYFIAVPEDGEVIEIFTCIGGTIATADETITCSIGGTAITGGALTIAYSGSAAGDIDRVYPTAANRVVAGHSTYGYLSAATAGDSTNAATYPCVVTFVIER